jgi:alanyl-tRNA synthetase
MEDNPKFKEGDVVDVEVDEFWRTQLSQHHTATHIVNAAARDILGTHVNQAGAKKTQKNSHLDITHYEQIPPDKLFEIEKRSNEIVKEGIDLNLKFMPRTEAEQQYGMAIYQGGAVPGKKVRIVEVPGVDVEACGGTHLNNTSETGEIMITKSQKIQDGIVRLTFTAGKATQELKDRNRKLLDDLKSILNVESDLIVSRANELLEKWKNVNKALKNGKIKKSDLDLTSSKTFDGDILRELSKLLNVKKDQVPTKIKKFHTEWKQGKEKLKSMQNVLSKEFIETLINESINFKNYKLIIKKFENLDQNDLRNLSIKVVKKENSAITIFLNKTEKGIMITGMLGSQPSDNSDFNIGNFIKDFLAESGGKGGGRKDYGQGLIPKTDIDIQNIINKIESKFLED